MKEEATLEDWRDLYAAMGKIIEAAPWKFMSEDMIFGVQNPETSEIGFVSVMGMLGEHLALAVYIGAEGLYNFWGVHEQEVEPELILETPQFQASLEDRNTLDKKDRDLIKKLGLKFRGRQAWPMFRSYRPGFAPWFLTGPEVRFLTHALTQAADVVQQLDDNPELLNPLDDFTYLIRIPTVQDEKLVWSNRLMEVPPPEPHSIAMPMDMEALAAVQELPLSNSRLEIDFFLMPTPIQENRNERPFFPYNLLVVERTEGFILGTQVLSPATSLEEMLGGVAVELVYILQNAAMRPRAIYVHSPRLHGLLEPVCIELDIDLVLQPYLPMLGEAKETLFAYLGGEIE